jgi:ABC-type bacteriocin/lantibiotic exporter with double-glycine peptidase domain
MLMDGVGEETTLGEIEGRIAEGAGGATMLSLQAAAKELGLRVDGWRLRWESLQSMTPCVLLCSFGHFIVVDSVHGRGDVWLRDPSSGRWWIHRKVLERLWRGEALVPQFSALRGMTASCGQEAR